ncbi:uncharacterized protein HKW66_Vig0035430 [Vigna angularis]|uniref:Uncharacterized protein n=2 Tax=Phaseolus angularis TaxID=3914 RepID=A0A8T0LB43_PHAAN|nr:uncharacterized protein LOC108336110 [Vigna angularis]KAG2408721.1 uncharacterized protein HKW66_Vig0035430 [Vigna angularis]BAT75476.1 hypothetical protein VIGAN_01334400 [Vigna angularis var. angularis]
MGTQKIALRPRATAQSLSQKLQRLSSKRMATQENEEDQIINPFTMLLLEDHDKHGTSTTLHEAAPNHHLLQNHFLSSIQSTLTIRQLPSEGLSFQLWPAATSLVSLLDRYRADPSSSPLSAALNGRLRILELGSGTGIVGIVAAATLGGHVTLTDLPHVVPNLKFNADANAGVVGPRGGELTVAPLRWGHADDVEAIGRDFDLIVASDVVYHDHLYEPLLETLRLMMLTEGAVRERKEKMMFLMAHLRRWKKESAFFRKAKKHFHVDVLHTDPPCDGSRVGVVVYRFVGKI